MNIEELKIKIVNEMDNWDPEALLEWAKEQRHIDLDDLQDEDIYQIATQTFGDWEQGVSK